MDIYSYLKLKYTYLHMENKAKLKLHYTTFCRVEKPVK